MQPPKFRYTLILESGEFDLLNAPEGWEETFLKNQRSTDYWGLIRSFTMPMKFVLDGAYLLRKEFYEKGIPAKAQIRVEILENRTWAYRLVYEGEIDFTEFEDSSDGNSVTVRATDIGIAEMIASYDKAVYEIDLPGTVLVEIPGVSLIDAAQLLVLPQLYDYPNPGSLILPADVEENELINEKVETQNSEQELNPDLGTSDNWLLRANENTTVTLSGTIEANWGASDQSERALVEIYDNTGVKVATLANASFPRVGRVDYSVTFPVVAGRRYFLILDSIGDLGNFVVQFFSVKILNEILTPSSVARAFRAEDLFKLLLVLMNGSDGGAQSDLLRGSNLFITCGDAIREFESPKLKTSFQDFYRSMDFILNAGFGIDGVPRLETKEFFFRDSVCLDLGEVKEFSLSIETNLLFNTLKVGYREQEYENDQGREEFNQGQVWTTENRKTDSVLDRVVPYRADQQGIADLRRLTVLDNLKGIDSKSDNDIWVLQGSGVEVDGVQKLETGADLDYVTGIPNPATAINIRLSPKNNLLRSGSFVRVGLMGFDETLIRFASAEKNAELVAQIDGRVIVERSDVAVASLNKRLFLPYLAKIKVALYLGAWAVIDANRYGFMKFRFNGVDYRGFLKEGDTDLGQNTEREFRLYLHADTNLTSLIR